MIPVMPREGYGNLSIKQSRLDQIQREFDMKIKKHDKRTFSEWATSTLEDAIKRHQIISKIFPSMHFVGKTKNGGIIIEDKKELVEVTLGRTVECAVHDYYCEHCLFATLHYNFV